MVTGQIGLCVYACTQSPGILKILSTSNSNSQFQIFIITICSTICLFITHTHKNTGKHVSLGLCCRCRRHRQCSSNNGGRVNRLYQRNYSYEWFNKFTELIAFAIKQSVRRAFSFFPSLFRLHRSRFETLLRNFQKAVCVCVFLFEIFFIQSD